ncbi:probable sulfate transporter 4.2 [Quercus lobata]|uniref:probable sulfate transporter 4.2 n=1 Tax=Quercus lobata TaxID=97700 RepID=UPI001243D28F|nr:probable sulfate transporter 4.2 [Quercus lobata]
MQRAEEKEMENGRDFLSHAAIMGFVAGAAIVIGLQQLKGFLGISHFTNKTDIISVVEVVHHHWSALNFILWCSFLSFILITIYVVSAISFTSSTNKIRGKFYCSLLKGLQGPPPGYVLLISFPCFNICTRHLKLSGTCISLMFANEPVIF